MPKKSKVVYALKLINPAYLLIEIVKLPFLVHKAILSLVKVSTPYYIDKDSRF
jgi:hypothetical protein